MIKTAIFDMDGLMFDTERLYAEAWFQLGRETGYEIREEHLVPVRGSDYETIKGLFHQFFGEEFDYDSKKERQWEISKEMIKQGGIPLKPGLSELLQYLKDHGYKRAMATSTAMPKVKWYLELAGIPESEFDAIITGDMVVRSKPNPEIFLKAAAAVGTMPEESIVLEDSFNGINGAVNGGFLPVMVPDLMFPDEEMEKRLFAKCETLYDVIALLEKE